jgi:hypothetical protein
MGNFDPILVPVVGGFTLDAFYLQVCVDCHFVSNVKIDRKSTLSYRADLQDLAAVNVNCRAFRGGRLDRSTAIRTTKENPRGHRCLRGFPGAEGTARSIAVAYIL